MSDILNFKSKNVKMLKCFIDNPVQLDVGYYGRSFLDNNHSMYPYLSDRTTYPKWYLHNGLK